MQSSSNLSKEAASVRCEGTASVAAKTLLRRLFDLIGRPPIQINLWNGMTIAPASGDSSLAVDIHDWQTLVGLFFHPDLYFGRAFSEGRLTIRGDLINFLTTVQQHRNSHQENWRERLIYWLTSRPRMNTLEGSRRNIHQHYDLGNEFYKLWLDQEAMQYTCAYYATPDATLEQAQIAKMEHVCRKLQLKPGDTVVEAGCGWGGLGLYMAKKHGVRVRAFNISQEQIAYARQRVKEEGLEDWVEYVEDDYRNISGKYDVFVSVGMLEHVGPQNYHQFGRLIKNVLKPDGRALVHSIGRNRVQLVNAWIEKHIFPGAYPPTVREMMEIVERNDFSVLDIENLRLHYARTCEEWLNRFEQHQENIEAMFDPAFVRAWRLYLAGSSAAFKAGGLQLFQMVFSRARKTQIPMTRNHIYSD